MKNDCTHIKKFASYCTFFGFFCFAVVTYLLSVLHLTYGGRGIIAIPFHLKKFNGQTNELIFTPEESWPLGHWLALCNHEQQDVLQISPVPEHGSLWRKLQAPWCYTSVQPYTSLGAIIILIWYWRRLKWLAPKWLCKNSLGFGLQSDKEFWFGGSEGEWLTAHVHMNLQRGHIELAVGIAITWVNCVFVSRSIF